METPTDCAQVQAELEDYVQYLDAERAKVEAQHQRLADSRARMGREDCGGIFTPEDVAMCEQFMARLVEEARLLAEARERITPEGEPSPSEWYHIYNRREEELGALGEELLCKFKRFTMHHKNVRDKLTKQIQNIPLQIKRSREELSRARATLYEES